MELVMYLIEAEIGRFTWPMLKKKLNMRFIK